MRFYFAPGSKDSHLRIIVFFSRLSLRAAYLARPTPVNITSHLICVSIMLIRRSLVCSSQGSADCILQNDKLSRPFLSQRHSPPLLRFWADLVSSSVFRLSFANIHAHPLFALAVSYVGGTLIARLAQISIWPYEFEAGFPTRNLTSRQGFGKPGGDREKRG